MLENTRVGSSLFRFIASDIDMGLNAHITYFINDSAIMPIFSVSRTNATLLLNSGLDYESDNKTYVFYVFAIDSGNRTGRARVTVQVLDFNDNQPMFIGKICLYTYTKGAKVFENFIIYIRIVLKWVYS